MIDRNSLVMIAKLYYIGNLSQEKIAQMMGLSRLKVSRLLKICREKRIVEFSFNANPLHREDMAHTIKNAYNLKDVIIVKSDTSVEKTKAAIGEAALQYFTQKVQDNMSIGISWGTTIHYFLQRLSSMKDRSGCKVIQLTGGMYIPEINIDGREQVRVFASKLNASWHLMQTPLVVQNVMTKQLLMEEPEIQRHFALFNEIDIAMVGLGSALPEKSVTYMANYITLEESKQLAASGAVADICGNRLTADGQAANCCLSNRVLAIEPSTLAKIPLVIGLGEGAEKAATIVAGMRGGILKALIIDELAAIAVLKAENLTI